MPSAYGFPNCVGWYVANQGVYSDAGSTPAVAGSPVYQWNDQSGNGNHLVQAVAANRPVYNPYQAVQGPAGPPAFTPFGNASSYYTPAGRPAVLFDGVNSFLNIPASLALPSTGCTVVMCTRGAYFAPVSFGTDGQSTINYGWVSGGPPRMAMYNYGLRPFAGPTFLPEMVPFVHGFRASLALGETRLYMGTNQQSTFGANCCNFNLTGGAVGRTLNVNDGSYGNHSFAGEVFEVAVYASPLGNAMMATLLADMQATNGIRADANTCQAIFVGDSLTAGGPYPGPMTASYPWHLCQLYANAVKPLVLAVPGQTIAQQQSLAMAVTTGLDLGPFTTSAAVVCCGSRIHVVQFRPDALINDRHHKVYLCTFQSDRDTFPLAQHRRNVWTGYESSGRRPSSHRPSSRTPSVRWSAAAASSPTSRASRATDVAALSSWRNCRVRASTARASGTAGGGGLTGLPCRHPRGGRGGFAGGGGRLNRSGGSVVDIGTSSSGARAWPAVGPAPPARRSRRQLGGSPRPRTRRRQSARLRWARREHVR